MKRQRPTLLYGLLTALVLVVLTLVVARSAGWIGVTERLPVELAQVERTDIETTVSGRGYVQAAREVVIRSELPGELVALPVAEGDTIVAGQLLAVIRPDRIDAELARAQAVVEQRRAARAEAQAQVQGAKARRQQAEATYRRSLLLHRRAVIADAEWEQAQADFRTACQNERAARQRAEEARYAVQEARAQVREVAQNKELTRLHAPRRGTVVSRSVNPGERVAGTGVREGTELLRLADLQYLEVQIAIEEADVLPVTEGQSARVRLEALPNQPLRGTVAQVAYQATDYGQPGGSAFAVHISLDSVPVPLRIGMTAEVDITTQTRNHALTVPLLAASPRPDYTSETDSLQDVLFVYQRGTVKQRKVRLGLHNRDRIEILEGLEEGETVVSGPYHAVFHQLRDGMLVTAAPDNNRTPLARAP